LWFAVTRQLSDLIILELRIQQAILEFGLSSSGDEVNLYDPEGRLVDFVRYDVVSPWPLNVSEGGSIELSDPYSDNNNGSQLESFRNRYPWYKQYRLYRRKSYS
jgi:hypothetical protein